MDYAELAKARWLSPGEKAIVNIVAQRGEISRSEIAQIFKAPGQALMELRRKLAGIVRVRAEPLYTFAPELPPVEVRDPNLVAHYVTRPIADQQKVVLREMICLPIVPRARLIEALFAHREDGGAEDGSTHVRVLISRLRAALKPQWRIVTQYGSGYRLTRIE